MKMEKRLMKIADTLVSVYVFAVAVMLVLYMVANFIGGFSDFIPLLKDLVTNSSDISEISSIETSMLHFIAFTIVLVKAYKILASYAAHQHVSIKYIVEISIIAPAVELFFNSHAYSMEILLIFGIYGIANLTLYLIYYKVFQKMDT